jgi:hypothetical protein
VSDMPLFDPFWKGRQHKGFSMFVAEALLKQLNTVELGIRSSTNMELETFAIVMYAMTPCICSRTLKPLLQLWI